LTLGKLPNVQETKAGTDGGNSPKLILVNPKGETQPVDGSIATDES
jgi:hypothetical protein